MEAFITTLRSLFRSHHGIVTPVHDLVEVISTDGTPVRDIPDSVTRFPLPLASNEMLMHLRIFKAGEPFQKKEIIDVKEQVVCFPTGKEWDRKTQNAFAVGWFLAVYHVLAFGSVEVLMPKDFEFPKDMFKLKRINGFADVEKALLQKSRFGRWL